MRALLVALALVPRLAHADSEAEVVASGQGLAKDGRYSEAIDAFKAADKLEVRASHACLIALAYTRRELWPQAEVWLATCQKRARPTDPLPDWFDDMTTQIAERLATVNAAPVVISVQPSTAKLSVSSFAADEEFEPRTIHLPVGHHVIVARAPGYVVEQRAIDVTDKTPQHVAIVLHRPPPPPSKTLLYVGGVALAAGVLTYGWMSYEYLAARDSFDGYNAHIDRLHVAKWTTAGLWSAGAIVLAAGYYIYRRDRRDEAPVVAAAPIPNGGIVVIGWQR